MTTSDSLGSAAEYGNFYAANATAAGKLSATVDAVATALAAQQLKVSTMAMRNQFSQYNRVFSSMA